MAGTATLKNWGTLQSAYGYEVYKVRIEGGDTTQVVTPKFIKSIQFVTITPMDASSDAGGIPYITTFTVGAATVTITGATTTNYMVKIEGKITS